MINNNCCIVIPIYKEILSETDIISLKQCLKILSKYHIVFITNKKLDCSAYIEICRKYNTDFSFEYFHYCYSFGINGYNALLLSKKFYTRFKNYTYILIYQLDAYVFRDELDYWCGQGYDYIGAPWMSIKSILDTPKFGNHYNLTVGNGGFSLRKIGSFIMFSPKIQHIHFLCLIITLFNILGEKSKKNIVYRLIRYISFPLKLIVNKLNIITDSKKHEDVAWSKLLQNCGNIPSGDIAALFAFEVFADYLYEEYTNRKLPFGCHAWTKYSRWQLFWEKYIPLE